MNSQGPANAGPFYVTISALSYRQGIMGFIKYSNKDRAYELDLLRGIALVMMMCMHFSYDIRYEFGCDAFSYLSSYWYWVFVHPFNLVLFVGISGICCSFSRNNVKRGAKLLAVAMAFTVVTAAVSYITANVDPLPEIYCLILFNVLHLLSLSTLIYALLEYLMNKLKLNDKAQSFIIGMIGLYIMLLVTKIHYYDGLISNWLLIPVGIEVNDAPYVVDFMYIVPWMGVFLAGAALGKVCYKEKKSLFPTPNPTLCKIKAPIEFLGRHSLIVYLVHQPIGFAILFVFFKLIGKI